MKRRTLIVAHPDDEVIFAGALMLANPDTHWTVIIATQSLDTERGERARAASAHGGWDLYLLGLADGGPVLGRAEYEEWRNRVRAVRALLPAQDDYITHNRMGDYGHGHHMALNAICHDLELCTWEFYTDALSGVGPQWKGRSTSAVRSSDTNADFHLLRQKRNLMRATYPAEFDTLAAAMPLLIEEKFWHTETITR